MVLPRCFVAEFLFTGSAVQVVGAWSCSFLLLLIFLIFLIDLINLGRYRIETFPMFPGFEY